MKKQLKYYDLHKKQERARRELVNKIKLQLDDRKRGYGHPKATISETFGCYSECLLYIKRDEYEKMLIESGLIVVEGDKFRHCYSYNVNEIDEALKATTEYRTLVDDDLKTLR